MLLHISGCTFTSLAEKLLHDLWVGQGGKVTQVLLVAGHLSENSPHDLPFMDNRKEDVAAAVNVRKCMLA